MRTTKTMSSEDVAWMDSFAGKIEERPRIGISIVVGHTPGPCRGLPSRA